MLSKALLGFSVPDKQPSMTAHYNPSPNDNPNPCRIPKRLGLEHSLMQMLQTCGNLTELDVSQNALGGTTLEFLSVWCPALQRIEWCSNMVQDEGVDGLVAQMLSGGQGQECLLDLSNDGCESAGACEMHNVLTVAVRDELQRLSCTTGYLRIITP